MQNLRAIFLLPLLGLTSLAQADDLCTSLKNRINLFYGFNDQNAQVRKTELEKKYFNDQYIAKMETHMNNGWALEADYTQPSGSYGSSPYSKYKRSKYSKYYPSNTTSDEAKDYLERFYEHKFNEKLQANTLEDAETLTAKKMHEDEESAYQDYSYLPYIGNNFVTDKNADFDKAQIEEYRFNAAVVNGGQFGKKWMSVNKTWFLGSQTAQVFAVTSMVKDNSIHHIFVTTALIDTEKNEEALPLVSTNGQSVFYNSHVEAFGNSTEFKIEACKIKSIETGGMIAFMGLSEDEFNRHYQITPERCDELKASSSSKNIEEATLLKVCNFFSGLI